MESLVVPQPFTLAGFTSGDGSLSVGIWPSTTKLNFSVNLEFKLTQHNRDKVLLESFIAYFGCGEVRVRSQENTSAADFRCRNFSDIESKIIPFFQNHKVLGVKSEDFDDWCLVSKIVGNKGHLTIEGLYQIPSVILNLV